LAGSTRKHYFVVIPSSHSIVLSDGSALIFQRKFFQYTTKNRLADPSEISALEFKGESRRFRSRSVSRTIGINRSIFFEVHGARCCAVSAKKDRQQMQCKSDVRTCNNGGAAWRWWQAEIAELQRILSGFDLREECKWGKPCYTMDGKDVVIIQGFKEYCALGFFQDALLKDPKKLLVQLGQVQAGR
jgi:hypothetical protein